MCMMCQMVSANNQANDLHSPSVSASTLTTAEILDAMQFDLTHVTEPMNTSGSAPYVITYQFAGGSQPVICGTAIATGPR